MFLVINGIVAVQVATIRICDVQGEKEILESKEDFKVWAEISSVDNRYIQIYGSAREIRNAIWGLCHEEIRSITVEKFSFLK